MSTVLSNAVNKSQQHQEFLGTPRIKPRAASREESILPLCHAAPQAMLTFISILLTAILFDQCPILVIILQVMIIE